MAFLQSSFKESVECHENISCNLVIKQKLFCTLWCHYTCRPTRCLSARFTTRPTTQLQQ